MIENSMAYYEEANDENNDKSDEAPLPPIHKRSMDMVKQLQLYMMCLETKDEDFCGILHTMNSYLMKQLLAEKEQYTTFLGKNKNVVLQYVCSLAVFMSYSDFDVIYTSLPKSSLFTFP